MVDAVLYHYGRIISEKGIQYEFSFRTYRRHCLPEEEAAEILMNLLEAGVAENMHTEDKEKRFLRLQGGIFWKQEWPKICIQKIKKNVSCDYRAVR